MEKKKRVLSAIQPTGEMHFGNYFGAVKNWVKLQEKYECRYGGWCEFGIDNSFHDDNFKTIKTILRAIFEP